MISRSPLKGTIGMSPLVRIQAHSFPLPYYCNDFTLTHATILKQNSVYLMQAIWFDNLATLSPLPSPRAIFVFALFSLMSLIVWYTFYTTQVMRNSNKYCKISTPIVTLKTAYTVSYTESKSRCDCEKLNRSLATANAPVLERAKLRSFWVDSEQQRDKIKR